MRFIGELPIRTAMALVGQVGSPIGSPARSGRIATALGEIFFNYRLP
jgi:hypothetical protein